MGFQPLWGVTPRGSPISLSSGSLYPLGKTVSPTLEILLQTKLGKQKLSKPSTSVTRCIHNNRVPGPEGPLERGGRAGLGRQPAGWSASPLPSSHRALRAGRSGGPDDGRGLLRVLRSHAGVTVRARICKWGTEAKGRGDWSAGSRTWPPAPAPPPTR